MRFNEPLTAAALQERQDRTTDRRVRALRWQLARLPSLVLYADQLQRILVTLPGAKVLSWICGRRPIVPAK